MFGAVFNGFIILYYIICEEHRLVNKFQGVGVDVVSLSHDALAVLAQI